MAEDKKILLAFYGDDFTGSTDALEFLSRAGAKTVLFLDNPTEKQLERFGNPDAIGVAGMTRAMIPKKMEKTLTEAFSVLKSLKPRHVHYKVCSTFDSSPEIGNIGTAIETGLQIFQNKFTPVLVAAPSLGRYSAFGNLYARMGIGSNEEIYRLDRHPSMCTHPVTPAIESDLRLHLAKQTRLPMGLIDLVDLEKPVEKMMEKLNSEIEVGKKIVFFDAMVEQQMIKLGELIDNSAERQTPLFSVGSSGIEKALGDFWAQKHILSPRKNWQILEERKPILVLSGSVSPVTASQIEWAVNNGFAEIEVDPEAMDDDKTESFIVEYQKRIVSCLRNGKSVILHTSKGPQDERVVKTKFLLEAKGWDEQTRRTQTAIKFGEILGKSALRALEEFPVKRLVIAGGDTSSFVAREMGIEAVEMFAPIFAGSPICISFATGSPVDGIEINLKGGQVGDETYFGTIQKGRITK